ncbi:MAG: TetR family transcriptional regulator [Sphingomonadales bacterium 35-56-22]|uniref:TetR/AcrR family transcriptional regulator n=1 Tax=Sphingorhabdus sp. TaxID=1902408 RepID=UPI000BCA0DA6|nr:TetR/AcrR family transcriptional regulator [Sphingorhabdus sp.]OYY15044.1 MAG: TetR family transcriptional regulator [Sphingomonadales bacterium 35-56-22]OYY96623.1 MAG: TetR family transcriptional regulator [Sphingomonadales bacterium 28-56-43]OYZ60014.1 MAG: TetR family transcriptional regulator [Sphingomonadales bacterium 24-56-14]OZA82154.1 MAG: TetR family transcriptional regulator [Sphingomonadales bacterium 39-57-19]HQS13361.1 TetR/AcrR family transcriptional regulator [Sphingorhabdu
MTPAEKTPRTERGRKTLRLLLDAAAAEFGEKGFHESSVVSITQRAGVALGSFYTYFDSKDSLFRALVRDMSAQVRQTVGPVIAAEPDRLEGERKGLNKFLNFVREHKELYRIIDEAEFVDPPSYRAHYEDTVNGYLASLKDAATKGQVRDDVEEVHAWAIVGMNVFLGLRFGVLGEDRDAAEVATIAADLLTNGLKR